MLSINGHASKDNQESHTSEEQMKGTPALTLDSSLQPSNPGSLTALSLHGFLLMAVREGKIS